MNELKGDLPEGFKMTELGPLPEEWEVVRLGDVFEFSRKLRNLEVNDDDLIPFIPMESISEESQSIKSWEQKKYSEISSGSFVFKNDIIIAKITPSFENGKQAILDGLPMDFGYATTEIWALHPKNEQVITQHLYNYIKIHSIRMDLAKKMEGSTGRQRLPRHVLENLLIPLPPLPEQRKIAAILSAIQEAKEKTEAVISATRDLKKSMMNYLFTYGPVPLPEAENVPLKETEVGMVPEEWEVVRLGEVVIKSKGIQRGPWGGSIKKEIFVPEGYAVYEQSNVISGNVTNFRYFINKDKFEELKDFEVKEGDILITAAGTLGKLIILPNKIHKGIINQALIRIRTDEDIINKIYFKYLFDLIVEQGIIDSYSHGATLKNLSSIRVLQNIKIPLPPLPTQQKIASMLSAIDQKIEAEENKKKALEDLFKTLLHNLMTAKIRVNSLEVGV